MTNPLSGESKRISLLIQIDVYERIRQLAFADRVSVSEEIRRLLSECVNK